MDLLKRSMNSSHRMDFLSKSIGVHRGSSSICWVLVRDLAIDMHFFGVIGFLNWLVIIQDIMDRLVKQ